MRFWARNVRATARGVQAQVHGMEFDSFKRVMYTQLHRGLPSGYRVVCACKKHTLPSPGGLVSTVSSSHTSLKLCPTCRPTRRLYVCGSCIGVDCRCRSAISADTCGKQNKVPLSAPVAPSARPLTKSPDYWFIVLLSDAIPAH